MATVGEIAVNVVANTSKFTSGMNRARATARSTAGSMSSLGGSAGGLTAIFTGITAAIGVAKVALAAVSRATRLFTAELQRLDSEAKVAVQTGIVADQLTALQRAADITGSSVEGMTKSLQLMVRNIGDAVSDPAAESAIAIERLGLSAEVLKNQDTAQSFSDLAQAISELPTKAERASAAADVFGRASKELVPLLEQGTAGVQRFIEEAQNMGLALGDGRETVEQFNDELGDSKRLLRSVVDDLLITVLPPLIEFLQTINSIIQAFNRLRGATQDQIPSVQALTAERRKANADMIAQNAIVKEAEARTKELGKELEDQAARAVQIAKQFRTPFEVASDSIDELNQLLGVGAIGWDTYSRAVAATEDTLAEATKAKGNFDKVNTGVAALTRNSAAAFSAEQKGARAFDRIAQGIAEQTMQDATRNRILGEIADNTKDAVKVNEVRL